MRDFELKKEQIWTYYEYFKNIDARLAWRNIFENVSHYLKYCPPLSSHMFLVLYTMLVDHFGTCIGNRQPPQLL
jgi:hypothetical protein